MAPPVRLGADRAQATLAWVMSLRARQHRVGLRALGVLEDQFDLAAADAASRIDLLDGQDDRVLFGLAQERGAAGHVQQSANAVGRTALRCSGRDQSGGQATGCQQAKAQSSGEVRGPVHMRLLVGS
jgi:hypothetical protein